MHAIAFLIGTALWLGATALLVDDAFRTGHWTVTHGLQPLLTAGTVAAAVWVHRARWFAKPGFLLLALLGSLVTIYSTMGRQAEAGDARHAEATAANTAYQRKLTDLQHAKAEQTKECRVIGKRCQTWNDRVDALSAALEGRAVVTVDPRQAAVVRLATLAGLDGAPVAAIIAAVDPVLLPLFLELGSVLFFASAFPHRKAASVIPAVTITRAAAATVNECTTIAEPCAQSFTREQALQDLRELRQAGSGRYLAQRWGIDPATASRWLQSFEHKGAIARSRNGKARAVLALPQPHPRLTPVTRNCPTMRAALRRA